MRFSTNKKICVLSAILWTVVMLPSRADLVSWETASSNTTGRVTTSSNGGNGWLLDGTEGVEYDFGALDALEGKPVDGSTVEFIFNFEDIGSSISIASVGGWSPGNEKNQFKLEQWSNTGKFGITLEGFADYSLDTDSVFDQDVHVVFRRNSNGEMDLFLDGAFKEVHEDKTNWRMDGGGGRLGSRSNGTQDVATGRMWAVASYDVPLTNEEIGNLYDAFAAVPVPEPTSGLLLLVISSAALRMRMRQA